MNNRGGGVALAISKNIKIFERKDLYDKEIEAVWCNVYINDIKFVISSVYIPPNNLKMINKLFSVVNRVLGEKLPVLLIGDFNAHHQYWQDKSSNKLGEILQEYVVCKNDNSV